MKVLFFLFCTVVAYSADCQNASSWNQLKTDKEGTLTCLWNEAYGIIYKDKKSGSLKGVCVNILDDFVKFVADKYNVKVKLEFIEEKDFGKFMNTVTVMPNVLGVSSVTITEERQKKLLFTPPFLMNPNVIVTNRDSRKIEKVEDLVTSFNKVKVVKGSVHEEYVRKIKADHYPSLTIEYASSSRTVLEQITRDKTLFTVIDFSEYLVASRSNASLIRQNIDLKLVDKIGFVMSKKSDWGSLWNEFLSADYRKSPAYKKIITENLGSSFAIYMAGI